MNVIDAITRRHSTRAFLDKPVDEQIIREILQAARHAPAIIRTSGKSPTSHAARNVVCRCTRP